MMNKKTDRHWKAIAVAVLVTLLQACAAPYPPKPTPVTEEYRLTPFITVQYCLPADPSKELLSIGRVQRYASDLRSASAGTEKLRTRTYKGQPVFQEETHQRIVDLIVATSRYQGREFLYVPPKDIPRGTWTPWMGPSAAADDR